MTAPATPLTKAVDEFVEATHPPLVRNHNQRSYLLARALADARGQDYDVELVYLICALHDVGLTDAGAGTQRFEVDGADRAAELLEEHGATDAQIDTVWDAIALHTTPSLTASPVFGRRRPPEIRIAHAGITHDVLGGPDGLPPGFADRLLAIYPRLGGTPALTALIVAQVEADPRKAPPCTLPGELLHQRHPDAPYPTWDALVAVNGWD
ncbi:HD domain-containing protein [Cryptosporangium aurantiacum]|uniref:Metal dependent phosphohydrolase n=1 Tax=Cryptosporangium aurantiacum TaxID=134849 RepID=A0A1M7RI35_9ACTN|nr:HD domain-containing protein [Cryptosporangium aurantiacum]SHN45876.1 metal dependent phosphohydrolase [Cryptosporangium aurantiacum]